VNVSPWSFNPDSSDLARDQVRLGDLGLLAFGVAREVDHLHPVQQGARDVLDEVRRGDEEHLAQVEEHVHVVVRERVVLRRVEDLEEGARGVALVRGAQLVDLVEEEDRVLGAGLLESLDDPAGHGADVGPAMPPDVGLVAHPSERDADIFPPQRPGDTLGDRGLPHPRRADEEEDRPLGHRSCLRLLGVGDRPHFGLGTGDEVLLGLERVGRDLALIPDLALEFSGAELPDGEEFEDAVLHVLQAIVVLVEDPDGLLEVEVVVRSGTPGELRDPFEVGADDLGVHRLAPRASQPSQLALDLGADLLGEVELEDLLAELGQLSRRFVLVAQLLLDGLELLAEIHLALALAQLFLNLRLDLGLGIEHADLALDVDQHASEPLFDRQGLQEGLPLGDGEVEVARHEVGEATGLGHVLEDVLQELLRHPPLLAQLRGTFADLTVERLEGGVPLVDRPHLGHRQGFGRQENPGLLIADRLEACLTVNQELHSPQSALNLPDPSHDAHGMQAVGGRLVLDISLRDGEDQTIGLRGGLDGAQSAGSPRGDRDRDTREKNRPPQRKDGERLAFGHDGPFLRILLPRGAPRRSVRLVRQGKPIPSGTGIRQLLAQL